MNNNSIIDESVAALAESFASILADQNCDKAGDGVEVHRLVGIFKRQGAGRDHEAESYQGDAGTVDAQAGNSADREREIACCKDDAGRDAPAFPTNSITGR
jgi:hypothetical protein